MLAPFRFFVVVYNRILCCAQEQEGSLVWAGIHGTIRLLITDISKTLFADEPGKNTAAHDQIKNHNDLPANLLKGMALGKPWTLVFSCVIQASFT